MKKIFLTLVFIFFGFVAQAQNNQNKTTVAPVVTPPLTVVAPTIITDPNDGTGTGTGTGTTTITEVGNTEGQLSVSLTGAATYSIPIAVPPGINGVVPQVSLNYSSQAGNGMAGYGWNIGGLSSITRIPQTKFHDGNNNSVKIDLTDRYALDGQRLLLKNGAVYGTHGAVYETENFSNIKITSNGSYSEYDRRSNSYGPVLGPDYFIVEYPDGSVALYGNIVANTSNSRSQTQYAITYWQNAQGVRINYFYENYYNVLRIKSIKYGSQFGNTSISEINFIYGSRGVPIVNFDNGNYSENAFILTGINVIGNGVGFRNYVLQQENFYQGYQRLVSITEKTGDNTLSYKPTIFSYDENVLNTGFQLSYTGYTNSPFRTSMPLNTQFISQANYILDNENVSADFDGDGNIDILNHPKRGAGIDNFSISVGFDYGIQGISDSYHFISDPTLNIPTYSYGTIKDIRIGESVFAINWVKESQSLGYKLMNRSAWCIPILMNYNSVNNTVVSQDYTFRVYSRESDSNPVNLEYTKNCTFQSNVYKDYYPGDFNGDGLTDVIIIERQGTTKKTYFLNLDSRLTTNYFNQSSIIDIPDSLFESYKNIMYEKGCHITSGDVNGDGKTDLIVFKGYPVNKIETYSLDVNNNLVLIRSENYSMPSDIGQCNFDGYESNWKFVNPVLNGDFNGDGKTDFLLLGSNRNILMSKGNGSFHIETIPSEMPSGGIIVDIDNDGKSDLFSSQSTYSCCPTPSIYYTIQTFTNKKYYGLNSSWSINTQVIPDQIARNIGGVDNGFYRYVFIRQSKTHKNKTQLVLFEPYDAIYRLNNKDFRCNSYANFRYLEFSKPFENQKLLSNITLGNGVQENITYSPLTTTNGVYTPAGQIENYPNFDIATAPGWKVVSQISKQSSTTYKSQQFKYYGAVSNVEGLGFQGFRGRLATNWYNDPSEIISNITKHDIDKRGAVSESFSVLGLSTPSAVFDFSLPYINYSTNSYNIVRNNYIDPLLSNKVFKLFNSSSQNFDGLNGTTSSVTNTRYDVYNNPTTSTTDFLNSGVIEKSTSITIGYNNSLPTDLVYYRGRPKSKIVNETLYDTTTGLADVTSSQELYGYNNHLLTQVKKKGHQTPDELIEDNIYDAYGNITKKTITATGLTPRVTNYEYDLPTHRFLTKKIDIEGLETLYTNNSSSGMLLTETLPAVVAPYLPRTTTYLYDKWFKLINVTDYLGKKVNYTYANNAEGVLKTTTGDDGSMSTLQIDDLGRKIRTGVRNIDTSWSYITKAYDNNDRLILETAPYNSAAPPYSEFSDFSNYSVWNESTYDVYGRVTQTEVQKTDSAAGKIITYSYNGMSTTETDTSTSKVKTTEKNSLGNIVSVSDNLGGNITYKYFANGNLKQTDCNNSITTITQDGWGRKKSLYEPSVGTYLYDYNNFGETIRETVVGKGKTEYTIDAVGKIADKKIFDAAGVLLTKNTYSFDPTTKLLTSTRFDDYANTSHTLYNYLYDTYKRVISSDESLFQSNVAQTYFKRTTSFDAFGRPERQESTAINKPDGKQMVKAIKNTYKLGYHHTILEDGTNKLLWQTGTVDARGQLASGTYGNGITITNTYDSYSYPSQKKHDLAGVNVLTLNTAFDPLRGNLTNRTNSLFGWNEGFTYDNLDRLINWGNYVTINNYTFTNDTEGFVATDPSVSVIHENTSIIKRLRVSSNTGNAGTQKLFKTNAIINGKYKISGAIISKSATAVIKYSIVEKDPNNGQMIETAVIDQDPTATRFTFEYLVSQFSDIYLKIIVNDFATQTITFSLDNIVVDELIGEIQNYNPNGSIRDNNVGSYAYTTAGMPFRASTITPADPSPAMTYYTDRDQNITYNVFKSPITITEQGKENVDFEYNANNGRSVMYYGNLDLNKLNRPIRKFYSADGTMEIIRNSISNKVEFIMYLGGDGYDAPIVNKLTYDATTPSGAGGLFYLHRDYQGSIIGITNSTGQVVEKRLFDAWGALIKYQNAITGSTTPPTGLGGAGMFIDRGYTGHEHLLNVGLINMNGRIYDPKLHRFLQPDNNIQDPYNTQNYNRYGYVMNNPMKYSDKSGEFWGLFFGYLVSAYIHGAQATGNANPFQWNAGQFLNAGMAAASPLISNYVTTQANTYLQNYSVRPDLNVTMGATPTITNGTNDHSFVLDENSKNIQKSLLESNNNVDEILEEKEENLGDRSHICTSGVLYAKPQITPKNMVFAGKMTVDWLTGSGPNRRIFNGGEIAEAMRYSEGVNQARNNYYATGKTKDNYNFGLQGLRDAGWNPIQQFVGSYHYEITPKGDQLIYTLTNRTSFSSAAYHIWPESWNWENGPMGNTYQTYIFSEPRR